VSWPHGENSALSSAFYYTLTLTRTYLPKDKPKYATGHTINLSGQIAVLALSLAGIAYCKWENRQRALGKRDHRLNGLSEAQIRNLGYRHPEFRYIT
jgi:hypothetical protein